MTVTTITHAGARIRYNDDGYEDYRGADTDPTPADRARECARQIRRIERSPEGNTAAGRGLITALFDEAEEVLGGPIEQGDEGIAASDLDAAADAWEEANGLWAPEEDCDYDD